MKNPIQKRLQAETFRKLAETFLGKKNFSWWAIFYAALVFVVTGWLPDGIAELLRKEWIGGGYKTIVSVVILLFIGFRLKKAVKYKGKVEVVSNVSPLVKVLAVFLSPLYRKLKPDDIQQTLDNETFSIDTLTSTEWEMPVKAIEYHSQGKELSMLYVLTSKQTHLLMPLFKATIEKLFPTLKVEELEKEGIEFQDIKEVFNSVEKVYAEAMKNGFKDNEILVDVTGGQATNSIAGAIATLAKGRKFQYVSTRDKDVISYDIRYFEEGAE